MSSGIDVCIYVNGRSYMGDVGVIFESDNFEMMELNDRNITLDQMKNQIHALLELSSNSSVSSIAYRYPVDQMRYRKVILKNDKAVQIMIAKHVRSRTETLELLVETSELQIDLNIEAGTSQDIIPYNISSQPPNLDVTPSSPRACMDDFSDEDECFGGSDVEGDDEGNADDDSDGDDGSDNEGQSEAIFVPPRSIYQDPAHSFLISLPDEEAIDDEIEESPTMSDTELHVGMRFKDKHTLRLAVKVYSVRHHQIFKVDHQSKEVEIYKCPKFNQGCGWRVRAILKKPGNYWQITKYVGPHTCVNASLSQDHPKLDADVIANNIMSMVIDKPDMPISQVVAWIRDKFGYNVSYDKAWAGKWKAIAAGFGEWEQSYALLPQWMAAVEQFMPGSVVVWDNNPCPPDKNGQPQAMFHRVFWAYKPCIDALPFLKPILQVDGTFLYGKYKGTLCIASSQDGNNKVLPIAFALVERETDDSWLWFLQLVSQHVVKGRDITLISDRHHGLLQGAADLGWQHHMFCLRHMASNIRKNYKSVWLGSKLEQAGMTKFLL